MRSRSPARAAARGARPCKLSVPMHPLSTYYFLPAAQSNLLRQRAGAKLIAHHLRVGSEAAAWTLERV
jgi:hypothetical protein